MIVIVIGGIYTGWMTPTESGAVGAFVVLGFALAKGMRLAELHAALMEAAKTSVMILTMIWGVLILVRFFGFSNLPSGLQTLILGLEVDRFWILMAILAMYVVLGMFMDAIGMFLLTLPLIYPIVTGLGYDPVWFGIIAVKMVEICLITPPIGLNCFVVAGVRPDIPADPDLRRHLVVLRLRRADPRRPHRLSGDRPVAARADDGVEPAPPRGSARTRRP